jgi:hypothetical protein
MVLPTGTISFYDIQNEMGGSYPISLNEYFRDNSSKYAYAVTVVPTTGNSISMSHFRGASKAYVPAATTYSVGRDYAKEINIYTDPYWIQTIKINIYWTLNQVIRTETRTRQETRSYVETRSYDETRSYVEQRSYEDARTRKIDVPWTSWWDTTWPFYHTRDAYSYNETYYVTVYYDATVYYIATVYYDVTVYYNVDVNYNVDIYGDVNYEALLSTSVIYANNNSQFSVTKNVNEGTIEYLGSNRHRYTYTNTRNGEYFVNIVYSQPP